MDIPVITRRIEVAGKTVAVRELTVAEVRAWTAAVQSMDAIDMFLIDGLVLTDLQAMSDLSAADIEAMTPTQLREVWDACKEVNADFFEMRRGLMRMAFVPISSKSAAS